MKVLFLTPFLPYAQAPHAVASTVYPWMRRLASRHEVDLISFVDSEAEAAQRSDAEEFCQAVTLLHRRVGRLALLYRMLRYPTRPKMYWSFRDPRMERLVRERTAGGRYDLVQVEYSQMAQYGAAIAPQVPRLLVKHDLRAVLAWRAWQQAGGWRRWPAWLEWLKVPSYELAVCRHFDSVVVLSEHNRRLLQGFLPDLPVEVIPPGMEVPPADPARYERPGHVVLFFGAMNRAVNVEAVRFFYRLVWPQVRRAVPASQFHIVGGSPTAEVRALAEDASVVVTGYLPDPVAHFARSDVAVAPMRVGGGILTKVLETMAAGLPVVATSVANEGIAAEPGREMLLADDPQAMAKEVIRLLRESARRREVGLAGQELVRRRFGWPAVLERWERLYQEVLVYHRERRGQR